MRLARIAAWLIYLGVSGFVAVCLIIGVYGSARDSVGRPPPVNADVRPGDLAGCAAGLDALFVELNERLQAVPAATPGAAQEEAWEAWIPTWRRRLLTIGSQCRLISGTPPEALALRDAYTELDQVQALFTTHVVQFAREIGPRADRTRAALENARKSVTPAH
jgi:hypothetical protein